MLKKNISTSQKLADLKSDSSRMLYLFIMPHLDIEGRHLADPEIIKGHILPKIKSWGLAKIEQHLGELKEVGLILLYDIDGERYLEFVDFKKYQNLREDREAESKIPAPLQENSRRTPALSKDKLNIYTLDFLKNIPETDLKELADKYSVSFSFIRSRAEDVIDYCAAKGKVYRDYKAALRNFIKSHIEKHPSCVITKKAEEKKEPEFKRSPEEQEKARKLIAEGRAKIIKRL